MQNNTTVRIALWGLLIASNSIVAMEIVTSDSQPSSPSQEQENFRTVTMSSQSGRKPITHTNSPCSQPSSPRKLNIGQILPDESKSPVHSPSISGENSPREENASIITKEEKIIDLTSTPRRQISKKELKEALIDFKKSSSSSQDNAAFFSESSAEETYDSQKEIPTDENDKAINYTFSDFAIADKPIYIGGIIKNLDGKYEISFEENNRIYRIFFPHYPSSRYIVIKNSNLKNLFTIQLLPQHKTNTTNNSSLDDEESNDQMVEDMFITLDNEEKPTENLFGSLTSNFENISKDIITVYQGRIIKQIDIGTVEITYTDENEEIQKINVENTSTSEYPTYALIKNADGHLSFVIELPKQKNVTETDDLTAKPTPKKITPTPKNNKNYMYTAAFGGAFIAMMIYAAYKYNKLDGLMSLLNNLKSNCNNLISSRFVR
jgi:hypothetical protein